MITVESIQSLERFRALEKEWDDLLARCPHRTPFLTHGWMMTWWKYFGPGKTLCILVLREAGRLVAIAPLMKYWGWFYDRYLKLPARVVETMANYHSNRVDFIYAEYRDDYLTAIWDYLVAHDDWHFLRLYPIEAHSPTMSGLRRLMAHRRVPAAILKDQASPYLMISGEWEEFTRRHLTAELRRKGRKAMRALAERRLTVDVVTQAANIDDLMETIFQVAEKSWAAKRGTAISSTPQLRGFYKDLARLANARGWLHLWLLRHDGATLAYEYNLRFGKTIYNLKLGFDGAFSRLSPGHALKYLALSEIARNESQVKEYDFLGDVEPYKLGWTRAVRPHVKVYLYHPRRLYARWLHRLQTQLIEPAKARWWHKSPSPPISSP
ncbi:MAG: GNAT family N-acetyltransferase [Acidobacteria bacterium]|nr:MAG: GNAT family N-acetyltransferase [Acidobacteriota bacterium]